MKNLVLASFLVLFSQAAFAQAALTSGAVAVVSAATVIGCPMTVGRDNGLGCFGPLLITGPTAAAAAISATVLVVKKEEIKQVQPDAYDFLAGGQMTYALEEVIFALRDENEEIAKLTEEEIAALIIGSQI